MWVDTTDAVAFRRVMAENPDDQLARLAYADYLEGGDFGTAHEAYSNFTRRQCDAANTADPVERKRIEGEYAELFERHWLEWWSSTCRVTDLPLPQARQTWLRRFVGRVTGRREAPYQGGPYQGVAYLEREHLLEPFPATMPEVRFSGNWIVSDGTAVHAQYSGGHPDTINVCPAAMGGAPEVPREFLVRWAERLPLRRVNLFFAAQAGGLRSGDLPLVTTLGLQRCQTSVVDATLGAGVLPAVRTIKLHPRSDGGQAAPQTAALLGSGRMATCHTLALGLNDSEQAAVLGRMGQLTNLERLTVFLPDSMPHARVNRPYPTEDFQMFGRLLDALGQVPLPARLTRLTVAFPGHPASTLTRSYPEIDTAIGRLWMSLRQRAEAVLTVLHPVGYMTENLPSPAANGPYVNHQPVNFTLD